MSSKQLELLQRRKPGTSVNYLIFLLLFSFVTCLPKKVTIDIGPLIEIPNSYPVAHNGTLNTKHIKGLIPASTFQTSRQGSDFQFSITLSAGTYDVHLGFIETETCLVSTRVFHIYINDELLSESFDIFARTKLCRSSLVLTFPQVSISVLQVKPIVVRLVSVSGLATLSSITIIPSKTQCIPVTKYATIKELHLAHSIPGIYQPVVDRDGNGIEAVKLDGRESHSHFSYKGGSGRIISYIWSIAETGEIISRKPTFTHNFTRGTTRVFLSVMDNACSQHRAETTITVTTAIRPGQYCYFYRPTFVKLPVGSLTDKIRPVASGISLRTRTRFLNYPVMNMKFVARCIFFIQFEQSSDSANFFVFTASSGHARVYKGSDLVLDTTTNSTALVEVTEGLTAFEVIYLRTDLLAKPRLDLTIDRRLPTKVSHDQSSVLPILSALNPPSGSQAGGTRVRIGGFGLFLPLKVRFGRKVAYARKEGSTFGQVFVIAPPGTGTVTVTLESSSGIRSNALKYTYNSQCDDILFETRKLKMPNGKNPPLNQPTSAALGNDGKLYLGMRAGNIEAVTYNSTTLTIQNICKSEILVDERYKKAGGAYSQRAILGIVFDPRDKIPRPYVTASTLYWGIYGMIDRRNSLAWSNGAVERFKPFSSKDQSICLKHDKTIVRNLPISDSDHGLNELEFTQDGDLLISVGGNTNMGLPCYKFGGRWETFFSASVVIAHLSRGKKFNGVIPYENPLDMRIARPLSGYTDVELYATGIRNLFSMTMTRTGKIFGVDMGPNCEYGNASTTCDQYDNKRTKIDRIPVSTVIDRRYKGECKYGPGRGDKLLEIKQGKFYGHPNLPRALMMNNTGECSWIDPLTAKHPNGSSASVAYQHRVSYFVSAKTGLREYGSNLFCGALRGNLIMSKNSGVGTYRLVFDKNGRPQGNPFKFVPRSGIRVNENVHGDLLFPQYFYNGVLVHRPIVQQKLGLLVTNALPFRHGRLGGTPLTIGGWGFESEMKITVGGELCSIFWLSPTEAKCTVPPMQGKSQLVSLEVRLGEVQSTLKNAILYMSV